jgi:hypothetical protein
MSPRSCLDYRDFNRRSYTGFIKAIPPTIKDSRLSNGNVAVGSRRRTKTLRAVVYYDRQANIQVIGGANYDTRV